MVAHLHLAPALTGADPVASAASPIRVLLADDHALMLRSLRVLLEGEDDVDVIAEAGDFASAVVSLHGESPHVLVLDLRLPGGSSIEMIGKLRQEAPTTQIVVLTMKDSPVFAEHALASGAVGFVLKERADDELPQAVRAAARGEEYVSPRVAPGLESLRGLLTDHQLTPREVEVLRLIALGHTSVEIARKLHVSARTVESHRARLYSKLGVATRADLVRYALGHGLLRA
jgi:two-component system response regulator NreC